MTHGDGTFGNAKHRPRSEMVGMLMSETTLTIKVFVPFGDILDYGKTYEYFENLLLDLATDTLLPEDASDEMIQGITEQWELAGYKLDSVHEEYTVVFAVTLREVD